MVDGEDVWFRIGAELLIIRSIRMSDELVHTVRGFSPGTAYVSSSTRAFCDEDPKREALVIPAAKSGRMTAEGLILAINDQTRLYRWVSAVKKRVRWCRMVIVAMNKLVVGLIVTASSLPAPPALSPNRFRLHLLPQAHGSCHQCTIYLQA
jgi:hypothetical protein